MAPARSRVTASRGCATDADVPACGTGPAERALWAFREVRAIMGKRGRRRLCKDVATITDEGERTARSGGRCISTAATAAPANPGRSALVRDRETR